MPDQFATRIDPPTGLMNPQIIPTAEPFFFPGGPSGCLLIHGFTGTPREMRWMGEYLASQGITALGIRLPGHATRQEDMLRVGWRDWLAAVEDGWNLMNGICQKVFLCGLSMGGCLSLLFASRCQVSGVIAMSTPFQLPPDRRLPFIKMLGWIFPKVEKGPPDWRDEQAAQVHVDYPSYPTKAILELRDLLAEMRLALPNVSVPVLLINSRDDLTVTPEHAREISSHLGSTDKRTVWVEDCGHVITCEPQRIKVFQAAVEFICQK